MAGTVLPFLRLTSAPPLAEAPYPPDNCDDNEEDGNDDGGNWDDGYGNDLCYDNRDKDIMDGSD